MDSGEGEGSGIQRSSHIPEKENEGEIQRKSGTKTFPGGCSGKKEW